MQFPHWYRACRCNFIMWTMFGFHIRLSINLRTTTTCGQPVRALLCSFSGSPRNMHHHGCGPDKPQAFTLASSTNPFVGLLMQNHSSVHRTTFIGSPLVIHPEAGPSPFSSSACMADYTVESARSRIALPFRNLGRLDSLEPIAPTRVTRPRALYDTPPPDTQPDELPRSQRSRTATKRAANYLEERARSNERSSNYKRSRAQNKTYSCRRSSNYTTQPSQELSNEAGPNPEIGDDSRAYSKSPTPIPCSTEPEGQPHESRREQLAFEIQEQFQHTIANHTTQELGEVLQVMREDPPHTIPTEEPDTEVIALSPTQVGGSNFHLDHQSYHRIPSRPQPKTPQVRKPALKAPRHTRDISPTNNDGDTSDTEMEILAPSPGFPQLPTGPTVDEASPFIDGRTLFLGYPPTPTPPPRTRGSSQFENISTSSKSLGDPRPSRQASEPQPTQSSNSIVSNPALSLRTSAQVQNRTNPLTAVPPNRLHGAHLDIVAIESQRGPSQTSSKGPNRCIGKTAPKATTRNSVSIHTTSHSDRSPEAPIIRLPASANLLPAEDNEEDRLSTPKRYRKPTFQDLHGNERHVTMKARDLTWAYGINEGSFQTCGTYRGWFAGLYEETWYREVKGVDLEYPSDDATTAAVNSIPKCRGHLADRVRVAIKAECGFVDPTNHEERDDNIEICTTLLPNSFHCADPTRDYGHYEGAVVTKCITAAYFHSSTAIGVTYPAFFKEMKNPVVALVLTMMQMAIEEWKTGRHVKKKLDANHLLSLYVCHYDGLKNAQKSAKGRMGDLQSVWYKKSLAASGANVIRSKYVQPITLPDDVRPDSPHRVARTSTPAPTSSSLSGRHSPPRSPSHQAASRTPSLTLPLRQLPVHQSPSDVRSTLRLTTPPGKLALNMPPATSPSPESGTEGRYASHAKGKGHASD